MGMAVSCLYCNNAKYKENHLLKSEVENESRPQALNPALNQGIEWDCVDDCT